MAECFHQLGLDMAMGGSRHTGLVLSWLFVAGCRVLCHLPHLLVFRRRLRAISTFVTPLALHCEALAPRRDGDLAKVESLVFRCMSGASRLSRAK